MASVPPLIEAIFDEANRIAPGRSRATDGAVRTRPGPPSDHYADGKNPNRPGYVHACDITHDAPGGFDAHHELEQIRQRCEAGSETRVKYLVSHDFGIGWDRIASPTKTAGFFGKRWQWRKKTTRDHASHGHISILSGGAVEQSTAPMFRPDNAPIPEPPQPSPVPQGALVAAIPALWPPAKTGPLPNGRYAFFTHNDDTILEWNSAALAFDLAWPGTDAFRYKKVPVAPGHKLIGLSYGVHPTGATRVSQVVAYASDGGTFAYDCT